MSFDDPSIPRRRLYYPEPGGKLYDETESSCCDKFCDALCCCFTSAEEKVKKVATRKNFESLKEGMQMAAPLVQRMVKDATSGSARKFKAFHQFQKDHPSEKISFREWLKSSKKS